jgi:hypothetical protein
LIYFNLLNVEIEIKKKINKWLTNQTIIHIYLLCSAMETSTENKQQNRIKVWRMKMWKNQSWIYNYLCNQCLSALKLWVRISLRRGVLDTTLCDQVCQWLATGRWFSPDTQVSSTNKTDHHNITEILLKVELNTITLTQYL